jgi:hypothetical protein
MLLPKSRREEFREREEMMMMGEELDTEGWRDTQRS